jgi:hypothetical protein
MPLRLRIPLLVGCLLSALACLVPVGASAQTSNGGASSEPATPNGGVSTDDPRFAPTKRAKIVNGVAVAPQGAPPQIVAVIDAANRIVRMPYRYGGGHRSFTDSGYDCSGSVSFALRGGNFLASPLDSSSFLRWGLPGMGRWITVYTNPGHAFAMIAGLRFDTGMRDRRVPGTFPGGGPRWGKSRDARGFTARHPDGF